MIRWLVVAAVLLVGPVQAQMDGMPYALVAVDLESGPATIALGSATTVPVGIEVELGNILCTAAATIQLTLTVADDPSTLSGLTHTLRPETVSFDLPAGFYGRTAQPPYTGRQEAALAIQVANTTLEKHDHKLNVTATYAGGIPTNCQGVMPAPAAHGSAMHTVRTGAKPLAAAGTSSPGAQPAGDGATAKDSPGLGFLPLLALVGIAAALRRR